MLEDVLVQSQEHDGLGGEEVCSRLDGELVIPRSHLTVRDPLVQHIVGGVEFGVGGSPLVYFLEGL